MGARNPHREGRPWRRAKRQMLAARGTVCWLCGHDGGLEADHVTPVSVNPGQPVDPGGIRPAHGANYPCPTCGRKCNTERGARPPQQPLRTSKAW